MPAKGKYLEVLAADEVRDIHLSSLQVLEEVGVKVPHEEVLGILHEASARVDFAKQRVFLPAWLVEEQVARVPSRFTWQARDPKRSLRLEDDRVYFGSGMSCLMVIDLEGVRRPATIKDAEDLTRLGDAMEHLDTAECLVDPGGVDPKVMHVHQMMAMAANTTKPFKGRFQGTKVASDCVRMAEILAGGAEELRGHPLIIGNYNTLSPLSHARDQLEGMLVYARAGLPILVAPEVQAGATGPATLAGALVVQNAEILSAITMAELLNPGNPVLYGCVSSIFDMRKGMLAYAAIEACLLQIASAQLARFYNMPSRGTGGVADSLVEDAQMGYETALRTMLPALAGLNYMHHSAGVMENSLTASYAKMVIDNEIFGMIGRFMRGIKVDDDTLALDVIRAVGPEGNFLGERHTLDHFRTEQYIPLLTCRDNYAGWKAQGGRPLEEVARSRAKELLARHHPEPLPKDMEKELGDFVRSVETREGVA